MLSGTGLRIARMTFERWLADLPLPPEPMDESSATVGPAPQPMDEATGSEMPETPMSEAAFSECSDVVWACFMKNPHLGAAAMATKLRPAINVVPTHCWSNGWQKPKRSHYPWSVCAAIKKQLKAIYPWSQNGLNRRCSVFWKKTILLRLRERPCGA